MRRVDTTSKPRSQCSSKLVLHTTKGMERTKHLDYPKMSFCGRNEQALEHASKKGSVTEYKKDGVQFCSFKRSMAGVESGSNNDLNWGGPKERDQNLDRFGGLELGSLVRALLCMQFTPCK